MTYKSQTFLQYCWWWWWRIMVITRMLLLKDLFIWWKRTSSNVLQVARFVWSIPDNDDENDNNNYYGDGIKWQWAWNRSELYLQLEQIQIPVSSVLVSLNVHCLVTTFPTCWQRSPRGQSARPGYIQHYMLSTLYVERGVPRDGQRDYMLTLYSQHYMLTLFLQKIARHYMLII